MPPIDAGINFTAAATDQRGEGFSRTVQFVNAKPAGGDGTVIGSYEVQMPPAGGDSGGDSRAVSPLPCNRTSAVPALASP